MTQILVTKPDALNAKDKSALRKAGVVCVEAEHPSEVRLIQAEGPALDASDMLLAAMRAIASDAYRDNVRQALPGLMLDLIEARRKDDPA